ncbi:aminoglycoside 6-adenylyltransferase [Sphingobacterium lactis]|uniref:Aminoglycoside 6-adenylyltransferase n=1 Tax=Sphingobacterium lactis TaxID=797291 RepID=A0A1H6BYG2_9SPHI|nr:aminoglycoside 6-adenylyltransferase [Sphingobacterium lactis]SEG65754.1 aminoglycoside 6-adenylyltransferase [Sphingobacterium lactis]
MQARDEKLQQIKNWIADNADIRAALLTSSLVNPLAPVDDFSDLDIELVFSDVDKYMRDSSWLDAFGDVLNYYEEDASAFADKHAMKMVQYWDTVKVDFKLYSTAQFRAEVTAEKLPEDWDIGYIVLADKDNLTEGIQPPSHQVSIIKKPTEESFNEVVEDFWWDVTYLPKCLIRGDLFYFKFMLEKIIRVEYVIPMVEWYVGSRNGWKVTTNKYGRLFKNFLDDGEWNALQDTFAASSLAQNWDATLELLHTFHSIAKTTAARMNYLYPTEKAENIMRYIKELRPK